MGGLSNGWCWELELSRPRGGGGRKGRRVVARAWGLVYDGIAEDQVRTWLTSEVHGNPGVHDPVRTIWTWISGVPEGTISTNPCWVFKRTRSAGLWIVLEHASRSSWTRRCRSAVLHNLRETAAEDRFRVVGGDSREVHLEESNGEVGCPRFCVSQNGSARTKCLLGP